MLELHWIYRRSVFNSQQVLEDYWHSYWSDFNVSSCLLPDMFQMSSMQDFMLLFEE